MNKLSEKKKELLKQFVDYTCKDCNKVFPSEELEIHRIKQGGEYSLNNIKVCCKSCHQIFSSAQRIASGTSS